MLIDAHAHLDRYDLMGEHALGSVLAEIAEHEIFTISNSMDLSSYKRNLDIAKMSDWVLPTFGIHPWNAMEYAERLGELNTAAERSPILGEIGLDHYFVKETASYPGQQKVFEYFLGFAREQGKLVTLHTKGAEQEVLELLERYNISRGIVHWYSGPLDIMRSMLARGLYFTVGIEVLHSERIRRIGQEIPVNRLLTETDNPGGPKEFLGEYGRPALVKEVIRGLAEARRITPEELIHAVQRNLYEMLQSDPRLMDTYGKKLKENTEFGV